MQKLFAGELLAHYYFALNAKPNQVEDRLPDINADGVYLHGTPPVCASYTPEEAADHPISYRTASVPGLGRMQFNFGQRPFRYSDDRVLQNRVERYNSGHSPTRRTTLYDYLHTNSMDT